MFELIFPKRYIKRALQFFKYHPDLAKQYEKILKLLEINPYHPSLRLHALSGKLKGLYSVSINLSYRITIEILLTKKEIIFINIGDHDSVYK